MEEGAKLKIFDPKVEKEQILMELNHPNICNDPSRGKCMEEGESYNRTPHPPWSSNSRETN